MIAGTLPVSDHEGRALSTLTEFIGLQRTELQPPDEISRGVFGRGIRLALTHRVAADALAAAVLLALSTVWLAGSPFARLDTAPHASPEPLRLVGLDPDGLYRVRLLNPPRQGMKFAPALTSGAAVEASGRMIETMGLPLPILRAGGIAVFHLERLG